MAAEYESCHAVSDINKCNVPTMSRNEEEDSFERIELMLSAYGKLLQNAINNISEIKSDITTIYSRLNRCDSGLTEAATERYRLRRDVAGLDTRVTALEEKNAK